MNHHNSNYTPSITNKIRTSILQNKFKSAIAALTLIIGSLGLVATNDTVRDILGLPALQPSSI